MEPALPTHSADKEDVKLSFRKPSQDAANRKYRRRTPIGGSDSSASEGSPLRRSRSPVYSKDRQKKDDGRELEKDFNHNRLSRGNDDLEKDLNRNRLSRGSDSHRYSDRQAHATSHDYARKSDYSRHNRNADDTDRGYQRPSRSDRELRKDTHSDYTSRESNADRSRDTWRSGDKYSRDKYDIRSKDKEQGLNNTDYARAASKSRHKDMNRDDIRTVEQGRHREKESQGERRDKRRSPGDYKNDHGSYSEELRAHAKDSTLGRDSGSLRSKEALWSDSKESYTREKRRHGDGENDKRLEKSTKEAEVEMKNEIDNSLGYKERERRTERGSDKLVNVSDDQTSSKKLRFGFSEGPLPSKSTANDANGKTSSFKNVKESAEKFTSELASASITQVETAQDFDAAKVAALKAAELVNRNLVGGSYLSTDQKKKLLWGNKKNTAKEESGSRWDSQLFSDRERQEKFNKLMSLRLPWYLWPIVGCEGRRYPREKGWGLSNREAGAAGDGLGEAIHCWTPQKRWPDSRPWSVIVIATFLSFLQQDASQLLSCKHKFSFALICWIWTERYVVAHNFCYQSIVCCFLSFKCILGMSSIC